MNDKEFMHKVNRALTALALDWPFWASIGLTMERRVDRCVPVAATDGREIIFNPEGFMAFPEDENRTFVMLHEVSHVILKHPILKMEMGMALGPDYNDWTFQKAADYVVNGMLVDAGVPPAPGLLLRHDFSGMSVEEVYMRLKEEDKDQPEGKAKEKKKGKKKNDGTVPPAWPHQGVGSAPQSDDSSGSGSDKDTPPEFDGDYGQVANLKLDEGETKEAYEAELHQRIVQAQNVAKAAGTMPGNFMEKIAVMIRPSLDWRNVLAQVIFNQVPFEYTYKHPHRIFLQDDIVMPTINKGEGGDVVLAVDSSGSVPDRDIEKIMAQFTGLRQAFPGVGVHVVYCDAQIGNTYYVSPSDDMDVATDKMVVTGRGGTDFDPVFKWVSEHADDPKAIVYLTDGWPCRTPRMTNLINCPLIWVLTADNDNWRRVCPRGEITLLDD